MIEKGAGFLHVESDCWESGSCILLNFLVVLCSILIVKSACLGSRSFKVVQGRSRSRLCVPVAFFFL